MTVLKNAIARVKRQFTSGNETPVERASVHAEDMNLILAALPDSDTNDSPSITSDLTVGSDAFLDDLKGHHNEICLYGGTHMTRLIGYYEDEDDCYYVAASRNGDKASLLSCVGGLLSLKKYLPEEAYKEIDRVFSLNGSEATDNFQITVMPADD